MNRIQYQLKKRLFRIKALRSKDELAESQFLSDLKSRVFDSRMSYYAFRDLSRYRALAMQELKNLNLFIPKEELKMESERIKYGESLDKLLFRLLNFSQAKNVICLGERLGVTQAYLAKVDSRNRIDCFMQDEHWEQMSYGLMKQMKVSNLNFHDSYELDKMKDADFVFISASCDEVLCENFLLKINQYLTNDCFVIVEDIYRNKFKEDFWQKLRELDWFDISFDLFQVGILVARKGVECNDYVLNYRF